MQNKEQYVTDFENINQFNKYFIFVYLPDLRYTINHADKILLTKEKSTYE